MIGWLILFVAFVTLELTTVNLVSIWFAIGSIAAGIAELYGANLVTQLLIFLITSSTALFLTRPFIKKRHEQINDANNLVNSLGAVTRKIRDVEYGTVVVKGQTWTAKSSHGQTIDEGTKVKIIGLEGIRLVVEEVEN